MSVAPDRIPVVVAVGEAVERDRRVSSRDLMERAARAALDEAPGVADRIQRVTVVNILNDQHPRPATAVARRLGLHEVECETTTIGGHTPQLQVTDIAGRIARGEVEAVLLTGAEALNSIRKGGVESAVDPDRADPDLVDQADDPMVGDERIGFSNAELAAGLVAPTDIYPMFECAMAVEAGRSLSEQRSHVSQFMARNTAVAAKHPFAWFPQEATTDELATPTETNRLISEPYTLRLNAIMAVDQGAALVVCSLAVAVDLGLADQAVFIWSGADCNDVWAPVQRPSLTRSPAIEAAGSSALEAAGVGIDDIDHIDFYSCFPAAVQAGANALGVALDDPRGLTVTGGLAYFGGPGNNYVTHSIATVVRRLRDGGGTGLCTGLGWYTTKHSVGIYGAEPSADGFVLGDTATDQATIDATEIDVALDADGTATVVGSTISHDREGAISVAPVYADLPDGRRIAARSADGVADDLAGVNLVGATIRIVGHKPLTYEIEDPAGPR